MLNPQRASEYLHERYGIQRSPRTLANKRSRGGGPIYHRVGKSVLYAEKDLDSYAKKLLGKPVRNTAEERARGTALPTMEQARQGREETA
jgi:hypothetical protein